MRLFIAKTLNAIAKRLWHQCEYHHSWFWSFFKGSDNEMVSSPFLIFTLLNICWVITDNRSAKSQIRNKYIYHASKFPIKSFWQRTNVTSMTIIFSSKSANANQLFLVWKGNEQFAISNQILVLRIFYNVEIFFK